jgi:hypothetical protein
MDVISLIFLVFLFLPVITIILVIIIIYEYILKLLDVKNSFIVLSYYENLLENVKYLILIKLKIILKYMKCLYEYQRKCIMGN